MVIEIKKGRDCEQEDQGPRQSTVWRFFSREDAWRKPADCLTEKKQRAEKKTPVYNILKIIIMEFQDLLFMQISCGGVKKWRK